MFSAITSLVAGLELVTELLSVAVILMALDKLATAIRWTYAAGKFTGRIWFTYGLPALLWTADRISWAIAQVDWAETAQTVIDCLKTVAALVITAATITRDRWVAWHDVSPVTVAPAVNPLFVVAIELEPMSCKQIRKQYGLKQRSSKAQLIGAALTC